MICMRCKTKIRYHRNLASRVGKKPFFAYTVDALNIEQLSLSTERYYKASMVL